MFIKNWIIAVIFYITFAIAYNQGYKILTRNMKKPGTLTVLVEAISGFFALLCIPLFSFKLPKNPLVYLFLTIACIFYAINDRLSTDVRKGVEASVFSIIKQTTTVFMIAAGILFFKEKFILSKIVGGLLIVLSNILVFYKKNTNANKKYIWLGLLASFFNTIALIIDVNYSKQFNIPLYSAFTLLIPAIIIFLFERIKISDLTTEFKNINKKVLLLVTLSGGLMVILKLTAYQLGQVIVIAPLCSLTIILNVIVGFIFLKEKDNILKKILAGLLILISIILINS